MEPVAGVLGGARPLRRRLARRGWSSPHRGPGTTVGVMPDVLDADLQFDCPRCGSPVSERLYGPCGACRAELVALHATDADLEGEVTDGSATDGSAAGRFEPGMNVVPNHVATKD